MPRKPTKMELLRRFPKDRIEGYLGVPPVVMANERFRWSYMTEPELHTRLLKITSMAKLRAFQYLAKEKGHMCLLQEATEMLRNVRREARLA